MSLKLPLDISSVKGFLAPEEGAALYSRAREVAAQGPCLEIGSYCGKSTVYLGTACQEAGAVLYALDHHRGSEEHQPGEEYHDGELYDQESGCMDSFAEFRRTLQRARLEETVIPLVASSSLVARHWTTPLMLVFIDGGHSWEAAHGDYRGWARHIAPGGLLAIHDIFFNPAEGGQAPHRIWRLAQESGLFAPCGLVGTLGFLRREI